MSKAGNLTAILPGNDLEDKKDDFAFNCDFNSGFS